MIDETETLTIQLPVADLQRLRRVAEIAQRSVVDVVAETLHASLPPLLDDIPEVYDADLARLEILSTDELWLVMRSTADPQRIAQHETLLYANANDMLDETGRQELELMRQESDLLMLRKAYSAVLLKQRGEHVPTLVELKAGL